MSQTPTERQTPMLTGTAFAVIGAHAFYASADAPVTALTIHGTRAEADRTAIVFRDSEIVDGPNEGHGTWRDVAVIEITWTQVVREDDGIDPAYLDHAPLV